MPTDGRAPIYGILGIADTYLRHKEGQREQQRLDIYREDLRKRNELAAQKFEAEYGKTAPDYDRPKIRGIADYSRGDIGTSAMNYPAEAYETKRVPGMRERELRQREIEAGSKQWLYSPVPQEELDGITQIFKDLDAQAGTNLSGALDWALAGMQARVDRGDPRVAIGASFHKAVTNPANVKNLIQRLDMAKSQQGDSELNRKIDMLKQMLQDGTFADAFFPRVMAHIREEEAAMGAARPAWGETEEGVRFKEAEAMKRKQIGAKATAKDTRGTFQKDTEFLAEIKNISKDEAADMIRSDKTLVQRLEGFNSFLENNWTTDPKEMAEVEARGRKMFGFDDEKKKPEYDTAALAKEAIADPEIYARLRDRLPPEVQSEIDLIIMKQQGGTPGNVLVRRPIQSNVPIR